MTVRWLGHSTVVIETAAGRVITDPVLRPRVVHLRRHAEEPDAPGHVDAVLLSHLHHDHLDRPSLRRLGAPVTGPPGTARALRGMSLDVTEVGPGEQHELGGVQVTVVQAVHDGRRWPIGERRDDDAIGFVVEEEGARVWFAGDTALFDGMRELGRLDLALVPIWGWGTSLGPGHMDPKEAATALSMARPAVAVPIHWGTFLPLGVRRRHHRFLRDPLDAFQDAAAELAPGVRVEVLDPGGSLAITPGG